MLRVRTRLYPGIERGVLALGCLRVDAERHWRNCERVVFVCTGNICRSPYAEAAARAHGINAVSCGTHTRTGLPADPVAIREAALRGRDMTAHGTQEWERIKLTTRDVVVTMQLRHAITVLPRARRETCRIGMLSSLLLPKSFDVIWDPFGRPQEEYARVFDLIDLAVERLAARARFSHV
jgi:protein-tyrosine phosphatase